MNSQLAQLAAHSQPILSFSKIHIDLHLLSSIYSTLSQQLILNEAIQNSLWNRRGGGNKSQFEMPRCVQCCHQMQNGYQAYCHSLVFTQLENLILKKELRSLDVFRPPRRKLKSELRWSLLRRRPFFLHDDDLSNQLCMMVSTRPKHQHRHQAAAGKGRGRPCHALQST